VTHSLEEAIGSPSQEVLEPILVFCSPVSESPSTKISKDEIRSSLRASTLDGVFATVFSTITGGVLLSNFLVELDATPFQIGLLASMPMLANLLQPLGAYWADSTTSRRLYGLWVYGISRLLWLPLAIAIMVFSWHPIYPQQMIVATLVVVLATHVLGAIGSASWLSWLATLVPRQLRGRYFGFRNSTSSLTSLVALPLLGMGVSHWVGGSLQGFGVIVIVGIIAGLISLGFQSRMTDVNPQTHWFVTGKAAPTNPIPLVPRSEERTPGGSSDSFVEETVLEISTGHSAEILPEAANLPEAAHHSMLNNSCFLLFLLYFSAWAFGVNLSSPFFNLYLLDNLALDLSWVTFYNTLGVGANLLMLLFWGKLADRIGNRPILLLDGVLVAVTPLLWLGTDATSTSIWLWFPLLHLLGGGTLAAIDLCMNNMQLSIAPLQHHTKYFAITAAIGGVAGAMGALVGGGLAQSANVGGMTGLFTLSSMVQFVALLPLVWLQEPQRQPFKHTLQRLVQQARFRFSRSGVEGSTK